MANPLKILANLSASVGVAVSGSDGLTIQQGGLKLNSGNVTTTQTSIDVLNTTATTVNFAGAATALSIGAAAGTVAIGGDLKVTGNDIKSSTDATAITLSGADVTVAGDLTVTGNDIKASGGTTAITLSGADVAVAGDLTVTGNDIKASGGTTAITLSGADVAVAGDLTVTGNDIKSSGGTTAITLDGANITVAGNLTVRGTTTSVDSTTVNIGDLSLALATGSVNLAAANGAGFSVGSGSDGLARFQYNNASTAFKSSEDLDVASGKVFRVNGTEVLSSNTLGSGIVNSSLTSVGTLSSVTVGGVSTLSGAVLFKTDTDFGLGTGSYVSLSGTFAAFSQQLNAIDTSALLSKSTYKDFRSYSYAQKGAGSSVQFLLSGTFDGASGNGSAAVTASCPVNVSGSTSSDVLSSLRFTSFDVATKDQGSSIWTNDLVSVQIATVQLGSLHFPVVTVDAPALSSGAEIRLIAVYEAVNEVI